MKTGNPKLEAILFDFMGVLLFLRTDYAAEKIVNTVDDVIAGVVDDEAFRTTVMTGQKIDEQEFQKVLSRIPEKYETYPPLWNLLPELRKKYKLGIDHQQRDAADPSLFRRKAELNEEV